MSVESNTFDTIVTRKNSITKNTNEDYSIFLTNNNINHLVDELPVTQHYKKNTTTNKISKINKLKRLKSFTTVTSNFSTIFTKSYDLNHSSTNNNNNSQTLPRAAEIITHDCVYLRNNNLMNNWKLENKKIEIVSETPKLKIFPRTNPHFSCRSTNNYVNNNQLIKKEYTKNEVESDYFSKL